MTRFAALACVICVSTAALAGPLEDSIAANDEGKRLYASRDYPGAVAKFREAWALSRQARYMFNLASVLDDMGRNAEAVEAYEEHLRHADVKPEDATAVWAKKRLATLVPKTGLVRVQSGVATTVELAGRTADNPTGTIELRADPGQLVVVVRAGDRSHSAVVEVHAGVTVDVDVATQLAPPAEPVKVPDPVKPPAEPIKRPVVIKRPPPPPAPAPFYLDPIGDALAITAVVAAGLGVYFYTASSSDIDKLDEQQTLRAHDDLLEQARDRRRYAGLSVAASSMFLGAAILRFAWVSSVRVQPSSGGVAVSLGGRF